MDEDEVSFLNREELRAQEKLTKAAKNFKVHFAFESLRIALSEAEVLPETNLDWIWETFYEELKSKADTAERNYILGFFIFALVQHGSSKKGAMDAVHSWTGYSHTRCRDAFYEIQRLEKIEENGFWFVFERCGKKDFLEFVNHWISKREFPSGNKKTLESYLSLRCALEADERKDQALSTGIGSTKAQYHSNKDMERRIANRQK